MAKKDTQNEEINVMETVLEDENPKEAEYDLVKSLLEAAEFADADNEICEVQIKRNGKFMFAVHIHPVSELDIRTARKNATHMRKNNKGKNLPKEKEVDSVELKSWLIYLATTPEDQQKIWGNPQLMRAKGLMQPWESVDVLLKAGEKSELWDKILEISDLLDDEEDEEELDQETFL